MSDNNLYSAVDKFIEDSFVQAKYLHTIEHLRRTVYWLDVLKPDADEALRIAALSHDIERAFPQNMPPGLKITDMNGQLNQEYIGYHQATGARIMKEFLTKQRADSKLIERVVRLISGHESGGDEDQNILQDADSLSFLENSLDHFIDTKVKELGVKAVREKFEWTLRKLTSEKAKQIAEPWADKARRMLAELE